MSSYIIPVLIILLLGYAVFKKINCYQSFTKGAKEGLKLVYDILPYIVAILLAVALMRSSGLSDVCIKAVMPVFQFLGVPSELCEFVMLRPFTGSGSLGLLNDIINSYGADSYISRCACVIMGSSETVFFVSALYFSQTKARHLGKAISLVLIVNIVGVILSCLLCRFL